MPQSFADQRSYDFAEQNLRSLRMIEIGGMQIAFAAAHPCHLLRRLGIVVRKMIDALIATRCITDNHMILYRDRDLDGFARHLDLRAMPLPVFV